MDNIFPTETEKKIIEKYKENNAATIALKLKDKENLRSRYVVTQIKGYQTIKRKMPLWTTYNIVYPQHLPLEQCSSVTTAEYKTLIIKRNLANFDSFVDLTGGFGVDFYVISYFFKQALYIDQNNELCEIVKHNFNIFGRSNTKFMTSDSVDFITNTNQKFNLIFIDPARRDIAGKKIIMIEDCKPNIANLQDVIIQKTELAMIKLSPMLDITDCISKIKNISEINIVAVNNECKEIVLVIKKDFCNNPHIFTFCDGISFDFYLNDEKNCEIDFFSNENLIGKHLYEPDAAIMKAGAFKTVAKKYNLKKLHPSSHLYISDFEIKNFPGRHFIIMQTGKPKDFAGITANLTVRNFPEKADVLKKKLKIKDGGDIYLFATTLYNNKKIFIHAEKK